MSAPASPLHPIPEIRPPDQLPDEPFVFEPPGATEACLMVHGSTGTASDLRELGAYLQRYGIAVHGIALPGHARRPVSLHGIHPDRCLDVVGQRWRALRERYAIVHVLGFSFGGALTLDLATREELDQLILLAPGLFIKIGPKDVLGALLGVFLPGTWIHDRMVWHVRLLRYFAGLGKRLDAVRCPVLMVHARDDYLVKWQSSVAIDRRVSSAERRLVLLEAGGHLLPWGPAYRTVWREVAERIVWYRSMRSA